MRFSATLLVILFSISSTAHAERVYKYTDEEGNTVFTDEPTKGAEVLDVKPVPTVPALQVPLDSAAPATETVEFSYEAVAVTSPQQDESFVNNGGNVNVAISLKPSLRQGDVVQLYFNGSTQGAPQSSAHFSFENLDRGSYTTTAAVFNREGKEVGRSNEAVTFHVRRSAIGGTKKPPR